MVRTVQAGRIRHHCKASWSDPFPQGRLFGFSRTAISDAACLPGPVCRKRNSGRSLHICSNERTYSFILLREFFREGLIPFRINRLHVASTLVDAASNREGSADLA